MVEEFGTKYNLNFSLQDKTEFDNFNANPSINKELTSDVRQYLKDNMGTHLTIKENMKEIFLKFIKTSVLKHY